MNKSSFFSIQLFSKRSLFLSLFILAACHPIQRPEYESPVSTNTVNIVHYTFQPARIVIARGQRVTWVNNDSAAHTVSSKDKLFDSGKMLSGQTYSYTFTQRGTYYYHCDYHFNMKGIVEVR